MTINVTIALFAGTKLTISTIANFNDCINKFTVIIKIKCTD